MERFAQILDDLDDLVYALGLLWEHVRDFVLTLLTVSAGAILTTGGILLALSHPPLGMAVVLLIFVAMLYRAVTAPRLEIA
jgi:hypothetical protein